MCYLLVAMTSPYVESGQHHLLQEECLGWWRRVREGEWLQTEVRLSDCEGKVLGSRCGMHVSLTGMGRMGV